MLTEAERIAVLLIVGPAPSRPANLLGRETVRMEHSKRWDDWFWSVRCTIQRLRPDHELHELIKVLGEWMAWYRSEENEYSD